MHIPNDFKALAPCTPLKKATKSVKGMHKPYNFKALAFSVSK